MAHLEGFSPETAVKLTHAVIQYPAGTKGKVSKTTAKGKSGMTVGVDVVGHGTIYVEPKHLEVV